MPGIPPKYLKVSIRKNGTCITRGRKESREIMTSKLAMALNVCMVSNRNVV